MDMLQSLKTGLEPITMKIKVSIRIPAQRKDISQTKIAELTGLSRATINRLWRGHGVNSVEFSTLEKIAEVLECSPLDFLSVTEDPPS